jgi:hypothetical protein
MLYKHPLNHALTHLPDLPPLPSHTNPTLKYQPGHLPDSSPDSSPIPPLSLKKDTRLPVLRS